MLKSFASRSAFFFRFPCVKMFRVACLEGNLKMRQTVRHLGCNNEPLKKVACCVFKNNGALFFLTRVLESNCWDCEPLGVQHEALKKVGVLCSKSHGALFLPFFFSSNVGKCLRKKKRLGLTKKNQKQPKKS